MTAGCVALLSLLRASASSKTNFPSACLSISPSGWRILRPKLLTTRLYPALFCQWHKSQVHLGALRIFASGTIACLEHHLRGDIMSNLVAVDNGDVFAPKQAGDCGFACGNAASESKDQHGLSCVRESETMRYIRRIDGFVHEISPSKYSAVIPLPTTNLKQWELRRATFDGVYIRLCQPHACADLMC